MGLQATTARDAALVARRQAFMAEHRLKDYKLSWTNLAKLVRSATDDPGLLARLKQRFSLGGLGHWIQWDGPTWDHLELFGHGGVPSCLVSHPYAPPDEACPDLELFRRAGLNVVIEGKESSWYGHGTYQVRVERRKPEATR